MNSISNSSRKIQFGLGSGKSQNPLAPAAYSQGLRTGGISRLVLQACRVRMQIAHHASYFSSSVFSCECSGASEPEKPVKAWVFPHFLWLSNIPLCKIHVYICIYTYIHTHRNFFIHLSVHVYVCTYTYIHTITSLYICLSIVLHLILAKRPRSNCPLYICTYKYIHTVTSYTFICPCVCMYIYIHTHTL